MLKALDDNVKNNLKKVNLEAENMIKNLVSKNKPQCYKNLKNETPKNHNFDWFNLKTTNEMLKSKLKTKLVQTINEFKNERRLREVMGKKLG